MFKVKVGYSTNRDAFIAGEEAANTAIKATSTKLGMLYINETMDTSKVLEGVKSIFKNKPIIGSTTCGGIITKDGLTDGKNYVGMMGLGDSDMIVGVAGSMPLDNPRDTGKLIAREAIKNAGIKKVPTYFYMVSTPKYEEEYLKGIEDVIGSVPFFGGSVSSNSNDYTIIYNDNIIKDGCAVAFFYAKNECKTIYTNTFEETKNVGIITKVNENRYIETIDNEPALDKYAKWTNKDKKDLLEFNIQKVGFTSPLGVKDPIGKITLTRLPVYASDNGSIIVSNDVVENTALINLTSTLAKLIRSNGDDLHTLKNKMKSSIKGYFLMESIGMKLSAGSKSKDIYNEINKATGKSEFLMIFTSSEFGSSNHSGASASSMSKSFTAFGE